jgi:pyruvate/2-oxoglutarate dehydrogenase complex dihydrolipoamide acyltransferase (E2) component
LIKVICTTVKNSEVAAFRKGKREAVIFGDINVSVLVEKQINGKKVPIPLLINKVNEESIESVTQQLNDSKKQLLTGNNIVLHRKPNRFEMLYYYLPGFIRRFIWNFMLKRPQFIFNKMGNVAITSIGMIGKINGWFIPISVHPICFGIGSVIKKPVVVNNEIAIREMLNVTVLMDHDVIDGAPMARFINDLSKNIENGVFL